MVAQVAPHVLFDAIFDAWWDERDVDPKWVRSMLAGKAPVSRAFAEAVRVELGVPVSTWPKLEPEYPIPKPSTSSLSSVVHGGSIGRKMEAPSTEPTLRRGRTIKKLKRPMAVAAKNSGLSIFAIAAHFHVPYSTAKSWGVKSKPPADKRALLARAPFLVPESTWDR
jgi:hypothetical protein